jgi:hypothetical protein
MTANQAPDLEIGDVVEVVMQFTRGEMDAEHCYARMYYYFAHRET